MRTMVKHTKGIREYAHDWGTTKSRLVSWCQRRCVKCQKFLSKRQRKYCSDCSQEAYDVKDRSQKRERYSRLKL